MVRAEMCTRLSKDQCEFGLSPIDDEIREQSALASFAKLIKGKIIHWIYPNSEASTRYIMKS